MTNYCSTPNILTRLDSLTESVSPGLITLAVDDASAWIDSRLEENSIPAATPVAVVKACEYYAAASVMHSLYDTESAESNTARLYEKRAEALLDSYIASTPGVADETHPYSASRTPSDTYIQRDDTLGVEEDNKNQRSVLDGEDDAWSP